MLNGMIVLVKFLEEKLYINLLHIPYLKKDRGYFARYILEYIFKKSLANHNKTSKIHAKIIIERIRNLKKSILISKKGEINLKYKVTNNYRKKDFSYLLYNNPSSENNKNTPLPETDYYSKGKRNNIINKLLNYNNGKLMTKKEKEQRKIYA